MIGFLVCCDLRKQKSINLLKQLELKAKSIQLIGEDLKTKPGWTDCIQADLDFTQVTRKKYDVTDMSHITNMSHIADMSHISQLGGQTTDLTL